MADRSYGIPVGYRPTSPTPNRTNTRRTQPQIPTSPTRFQSPPQANFSPRQPQPPPHSNYPMASSGPAYSDIPADPYARDTHAIRDIDNLFGGPRITSPSPEPPRQYRQQQERSYPPTTQPSRPYQQQERTYPPATQPPNPYTMRPQASYSPERRPERLTGDSQSSLAPLMADPGALGGITPSPPARAMGRSANRGTPEVMSNPALRMTSYGIDPPESPYRDQQRMPRPASYYHGDGYDETYFNPADIADDGDDGFDSPPRNNWRRSRTPAAPLLGGAGVAAAAAAGGAAAAAAATTSGPSESRALGDQGMEHFYDHMAGNRGAHAASNASIGDRGDPEKSEWLQKQSSGSKRLRWIIGIVIALIVVGAIAGGVAGGILAKKGDSSSSSGSGSHSDGSLYDINSNEVKQVLNNKNLHRVFPGMDYTPLNAQYPACLSNPPDQNNVTLDVAMLAQLSPAIRLYGTDCNQTEMVLTAIDRLGYNDTMKVWLGVWLDNNSTTSNRQIKIMYDILDKYPSSHFAGIIVGNEVLFRKDLTETQLGDQLQQVRNNLTAKGIKLPVATSDLGDDWTSGLAQDSDIVMANVHPFFAGTPADQSASWAWTFWQGHDVPLTTAASTGSYPKHVIAEIGWPSDGGNDCGTSNACSSPTAGSVAGIDNMNTFMGDWVCQSLKNATTYFWFEAFDEPWKVMFDTATDKWESKWGLFDSDRNLKSGLKIPDCGGQTIDKPY